MTAFLSTPQPVVDTSKPYQETDKPVAPGAELPESFYAFYSGCLVSMPTGVEVNIQEPAPAPFRAHSE